MPIERMLKGYHRFKSGIHDADRARYASLASDGQRPGAVVIACSDSRVDPAIVFCADPGDIFMIRNVANLVPPMEENGTFHGTSAALEYAVMALEVPNIVVLGHAHCGGIKAMIEGEATLAAGSNMCRGGCRRYLLHTGAPWRPCPVRRPKKSSTSASAMPSWCRWKT